MTMDFSGKEFTMADEAFKRLAALASDLSSLVLGDHKKEIGKETCRESE